MLWLDYNKSCDKKNKELSDGIVDIWLCQGQTKGKTISFIQQYDYFLSLLSEQEKNRASRYKFKLHQERFIISHGFTRSVLAYYLNLDAKDIEFSQTEYGKPSVFFPQHKNLKFNLSHTEDMSILAVTKSNEVGIDIEFSQRKTDWKAISQRFFTAEEQLALSELNTEVKQKQAFYELWTRKEAYMKVLGTGLSLPPTGFTLSVPPVPPSILKHHFKKYKPAQKIEFEEVILPYKKEKVLKDYCATIAVESLQSSNPQYNYYEFLL